MTPEKKDPSVLRTPGSFFFLFCTSFALRASGCAGRLAVCGASMAEIVAGALVAAAGAAALARLVTAELPENDGAEGPEDHKAH